MTVGEKIQIYRKALGLSQEELGQRLLISRQTVSLWEKGQTYPTIENLIRLRDIFGVSVDAILDVESKRKIRAVLMDMDGTLLGRSQVAISARNMAVLQQAIERGIHVIPCTGRVYNMLPPQLLTQKGLRFFITSHGARVYDRDSNTSIYEDLIAPAQAAELMGLLEGKHLYNEIAANGTIYLEKAVVDTPDMSVVPEHHIWYVRDNCFTAVEKPSEYFLKNRLAVEKMNIYGIPKEEQQSLYDAITATGFVAHTRPGAGPNLEFASRTLNKLNATDVVLRRLGISYEETLAIGDSSSDLEIIKACGIGIAMGNAPEEIQAAADDVTAANFEDGLAQAFEKYVL